MHDDWLILDEALRGAWEASAAKLASEIHGGDARVALDLPTLDEAVLAWRRNRDLFGTLKVELCGGRLIESQIHLPYRGVFIVRSRARGAAQRFVWNTWLGEREGWRLLRPNGVKEKGLDDLVCRVGFPNGECVDVATAHLRRKGGTPSPKSWIVDDYVLRLNADLSPAFRRQHPGLEGEISEFFSRQLTQGLESVVLDQEDLAHRQLMTFPRWLLQAFRRRLQLIRKGVKDDFGGLVPLALLEGTASRSAGRSPLLLRVDPLNPLELLARLTGVRRRKLGSRAIEGLSSVHRLNHPSFAGRLCPFETPESEQIGLALSLARGARVDADGAITPASTEDVSSCLAWGAAQIPFAHCNDGVRNMMGAKNLRQAIPVTGRSAPRVRTGVEGALRDAAADYARIGLCPAMTDGNGDLALGRDLLVAYMPWHGLNVDDAIVVSETAARHLAYVERKHVRKEFGPGWTRTASIADTKPLLNTGDLPLVKGDVIAKMEDLRGRVFEIRYQDSDPAVLKNLVWHAAAQGGCSSVLEYDLEKEIPLGEGDKLMGRHGNKGVVSRVLPDDRMPKLPAREGGAEQPVEVLLNPHGVLSRKAPAQLLETHLGYLFHQGVEEAEVRCPSVADVPVGAPLRGVVDHAAVRRLLKEKGLDERGAVVLNLPDGGTTEHPVVVGYQHIVRLHHVPELKSLARRGGPGAAYAAANGQAARGRAAGGGQRLGEMEVWALAAHGADHLLEEMLGAKSNLAWAKQWYASGGLLEGADAPRGEVSQGFPSILGDWLLACGIDLVCADGHVSFRRLSAADLRARIGDAHRVTVAADFRVLRQAGFACSSRTCSWTLPGTYLFDDNRLLLLDFLREHGLTVGGPLREQQEGGVHRFGLKRDGVDCGYARLTFLDYAASKESIRACLEFTAEEAPADLARDFPKLALTLRHTVSREERDEVRKVAPSWSKSGLRADLLLDCLKDESSGADWIGEMVLTCPSGHTSMPLKPQSRFEESSEPVANGLFDPAIFAGDGFGRIDLPCPVKVQALGFEVECLPVLPTRYRKPHRRGERDVAGLTQAYMDVLSAVGTYESAEGRGSNEGVASAGKKVAEAVNLLYTRIARQFNGKKGILRRQGLGRRVDRSARLVAVPDPELDWNQVGMPPSILGELMGDLVRRVQDPFDVGDDAKVVAQGTGWAFRQIDRTQVAPSDLKAHLEDRNGVLAVLNRQPSLHRDSMQAFHLVVSPSEAHVTRVSPLCCHGFALDFDGDEIVSHLPISTSAQKDAAELLPDRNLFSLASGEILAHYDRDLVSGLELLYRDGFGALSPDLQPSFEPCCRALFEDRTLKPGGFGRTMLEHLAVEHRDRAVSLISALARAAFARCTRHGMSFGFYDLMDPAGRAPDTAIALMTESGANGREQLPADVELVQGMTWAQLFENSNPARQSLCGKKLGSSRSGGLTRQLVLALWPIRITEEDCGAEGERGVATCRSKDGVCRTCYGAGHSGCHADGRAVQLGDPVGLWAAQSVGERGTQLTMKLIHGETAASALDMTLVRRLCLSGTDGERDFLPAGGDAAANARAYAARFRCEPAYAKLDDRHFAVLWRALNAAPGHRLLELKHEASATGGVVRIVSGEDQLKAIAELAQADAPREFPLDSPVMRVLFNRFGRRAAMCAGQEEAKGVR